MSAQLTIITKQYFNAIPLTGIVLSYQKNINKNRIQSSQISLIFIFSFKELHIHIPYNLYYRNQIFKHIFYYADGSR